MMSEKGVSDIIGCYEGTFFAIEVKTQKGVITEHQKDFLRRVEEAGGIAIVARSCEDVVEALGLEVELWPLFERGRQNNTRAEEVRTQIEAKLNAGYKPKCL